MSGILQLTLPREEPKRGRGRPRTPPEVIAERQRLAVQQQTAQITNPVDQALRRLPFRQPAFRSGWDDHGWIRSPCLLYVDSPGS